MIRPGLPFLLMLMEKIICRSAVCQYSVKHYKNIPRSHRILPGLVVVINIFQKVWQSFHTFFHLTSFWRGTLFENINLNYSLMTQTPKTDMTTYHRCMRGSARKRWIMNFAGRMVGLIPVAEKPIPQSELKIIKNISLRGEFRSATHLFFISLKLMMALLATALMHIVYIVTMSEEGGDNFIRQIPVDNREEQLHF